MNHVTVCAHFDGEQIRLDEPITIPRNASLLVTILHESDAEETQAWYGLSLAGLARAYGDEEPEYTDADLKMVNPDYNGR